MSGLSWLFLSEILVTVMVWIFIIEFNQCFSRPHDLEQIIRQSILAKQDKTP